MSSKKWFWSVMKCLGFAVFVPVIIYVVYPDMMSQRGWFLLGLLLFFAELIGLFFDRLFGHKKRFSDAVNRKLSDLFNRKKKKD
ncbi:MAG: hypothetical protein LBP72_10230 [Dysgonamonadaceae bacterium]|jgi:hypothetical protein|nr:hypothetical protein [Dysgonamonadaceae bacterium]